MPLSVLYKDFRIANVDLKSCTDFPPKPRYRISYINPPNFNELVDTAKETHTSYKSPSLHRPIQKIPPTLTN